MSEESKARELPNPDIFGPPFFGVGLGEKLGSLDARLIRVEKDIAELKGTVNEIAHTVIRHNERFNSLEERFNSLEKRLDDKFTGIDDKFTGINDKFTGINDKFANMEKRLDNNAKLMIGLFTALFVAIIVQKIL
jgi:uncharacterized coiled-coil protein SlyX